MTKKKLKILNIIEKVIGNLTLKMDDIPLYVVRYYRDAVQLVNNQCRLNPRCGLDVPPQADDLYERPSLRHLLLLPVFTCVYRPVMLFVLVVTYKHYILHGHPPEVLTEQKGMQILVGDTMMNRLNTNRTVLVLRQDIITRLKTCHGNWV